MQFLNPDPDASNVVALSGGKDSTVMALLLKENFPTIDFMYVCTPTGRELPEMFAHWRKLSELLGKQIIPITSSRSFTTMMKEDKTLPNFRMRWCTRKTKIEPYAEFLARLASKGPVVSYVGLRADEESREGGDYSAVPGVRMEFPLRVWGYNIREVYEYLDNRGICIPKRTDCDICFFQRLDEWKDLWDNNRDLFDQGIELEELTGFTFRSDGRDTWPASLKGLGEAFASGRQLRKRHDPLNDLKCRVCRL